MIRQTKQRSAIIKTLSCAQRPLSPLEVHELARKRLPKLGLRTVYRNIRELVAEGTLVGIDYPGQPMRYEMVADKGFHPHFICRHCNKIFDFDKPVPEITYEPPQGFTIEGEEVVFYGRCPECQTTPKA